jgi:DNA-binding MarR family transcriptional regulator
MTIVRGGSIVSDLGQNGRPTVVEEELSEGLSRSIGFLLSKAAGLVTADFEDALRAYGIRPREYGVLTLVEERGPQSQQRISERLQIDRTTMVAIIDSLEKAGLVTRVRDPEDRRRYAVTLSDRGRELLAHDLHRVSQRVHGDFLAPLPAQERARLVDMLITLIQPRTSGHAKAATSSG